MFAKIGNTELFYITQGQGRPMMLMHGGMGLAHTYFRPWLDPLAEKGTELVYYDQRGNGRSNTIPPSANGGEGVFNGISMETWASDADALRAFLGHEKIILFGHCFGSFIAQEHALRYGDRLHGLILCGSAPAMDYPAVIMANALARGTEEQVEFVKRMFTEPAVDDISMGQAFEKILSLHFNRYDPAVGRRIVENIRFNAAVFNHGNTLIPGYGTLDRLHEIIVPTLILAGRHDWITPPEQSERIHARIPNSQLVVFEESGHFPFIEEQERFLCVVDEWLKNLK